MPRREPLTSAQREELLAFPTGEVNLIRRYTLALSSEQTGVSIGIGRNAKRSYDVSLKR